jgi:hypothetical protein
LLLILVATSLIGAWVTWAYRIETTGVNLDTIGTGSRADELAVGAIVVAS